MVKLLKNDIEHVERLIARGVRLIEEVGRLVIDVEDADEPDEELLLRAVLEDRREQLVKIEQELDDILGTKLRAHAVLGGIPAAKEEDRATQNT